MLCYDSISFSILYLSNFHESLFIIIDRKVWWNQFLHMPGTPPVTFNISCRHFVLPLPQRRALFLTNSLCKGDCTPHTLDTFPWRQTRCLRKLKWWRQCGFPSLCRWWILKGKGSVPRSPDFFSSGRANNLLIWSKTRGPISCSYVEESSQWHWRKYWDFSFFRPCLSLPSMREPKRKYQMIYRLQCTNR